MEAPFDAVLCGAYDGFPKYAVCIGVLNRSILFYWGGKENDFAEFLPVIVEPGSVCCWILKEEANHENACCRENCETDEDFDEGAAFARNSIFHSLPRRQDKLCRARMGGMSCHP